MIKFNASPLSHELKKYCNILTVQVLSQQLGVASPDEQQILGINENNSLIRESHLCGYGIPWVFARTVVPNPTYIQFKNQFDNLGNGLLGECLLYKINNLKRSEFTYYKNNDNLYSRRSTFDLDGYKLLVMEIFLPSLSKFL